MMKRNAFPVNRNSRFKLLLGSKAKAERSAGVWIDGQYVGYVDELKDENKVLLLPGTHEISIRLAGYQDQTLKVTVEPRKLLAVKVNLERDPASAQDPKSQSMRQEGR
jgi:PEGA domain